jgi:hypothetical protein
VNELKHLRCAHDSHDPVILDPPVLATIHLMRVSSLKDCFTSQREDPRAASSPPPVANVGVEDSKREMILKL